MKKLFALVLCLLMLVGVTTGCGNNTTNSGDDEISGGSTASENETENSATASENETESNDQNKIPYITEVAEKDINIGSTYLFGAYEQDNNTSNGKEPIEWRVLDNVGNSYLLISEYLLDCRKYNSGRASQWNASEIRDWLNGSFLNTAFNSDEQNKIDMFQSESSVDKIFFLSDNEVMKWVGSEDKRLCKPTAYAFDRLIALNPNLSALWGEEEFRNFFLSDDGNGVWWLRTIGATNDRAQVINGNGEIYSLLGQETSGTFVRPALWFLFDISSSITDENDTEK